MVRTELRMTRRWSGASSTIVKSYANWMERRFRREVRRLILLERWESFPNRPESITWHIW